MPPVARTLGLMLVLASPVCLAAQTFPPDRAALDDLPSPFPPSDNLGQPDRPQPSPTGAGLEPGAAGAGDAPPALSETKPPLTLSPLGGSSRTEHGTQAGPTGGLRSLITVGSSLAVVLGLFFVVAWAMRRAGPRGSAPLPSEVVEVLGRAALASRGQVHVLRFGNKLLLVSVGPAGVETLSELTDPDEVNRLAGLCRQLHPESATGAFRQVFQQFTGQHASGFVDSGSREDVRLANAGIPGAQDGSWEGNDV